MRLPRRVPRIFFRHALAVAALLAQLVAATGAPILSPRSAKPGAAPFPCQDHPCGCATPEQGWAGDCCCFTLEQKLAWADERGIEPPPHVRPMVEARRAALKQKSKPCCTPHEKHSCCEAATEPELPVAMELPAVRWVAGFMTQKCRDDGAAGLLKVEVSFPPHSADVRELLPVCDRVAAFDSSPFSTSLRPPIPPPRAS